MRRGRTAVRVAGINFITIENSTVSAGQNVNIATVAK